MKNINNIYTVIVTCLILVQVHSQQISSGECKNYDVKIVQDFDASRYLGIWYEQARYEAIFQFNMDCVRANYSLIDENRIRVVNSGIVLIANADSSIEGVARFVDSSKNEGKLLVRFPLSPEGNYWVIGTDYDNYAIVWSCTDILPGILSTNMQFLWILARSPHLSDDKMTEVKDILQNAKLDRSSLRKTIQDQCPWSNKV